MSINKTIDTVLQKRQRAFYDFHQSTEELVALGVKTKDSISKTIGLPESFSKYLTQYNQSQLEFEWIVEYKNGGVLAEFKDGASFNFSHIELNKVKKVSLVSNFDWATDSEIKRVVVSLDMDTGMFEFTNGFVSQDIRAALSKGEKANKKLILFKRRRASALSGEGGIGIVLNEEYIFNQFVLAYEVGGKKIGVIVAPNGVVNLFE